MLILILSVWLALKKKAINKGPDYLKGIIRQICEVVLIPIGPFYDQIQLSQVKRDKGICFKVIEKENIQQFWKEKSSEWIFTLNTNHIALKAKVLFSGAIEIWITATTIVFKNPTNGCLCGASCNIEMY